MASSSTILIYLVLFMLIYQSYGQTFTCRGPESCSFHGVCDSTNTSCVCDKCYFTSKQAPTNTQCDFRPRDQVLVFLMSFFFGGFGVGRFLIGHIGVGVGKVNFFFITLIKK